MSDNNKSPYYTSSGGTYKFIPKALVGLVGEPYVMLKRLTNGQIGDIDKIVSHTKGTRSRSEYSIFKRQVAACRIGIASTHNFIDEHGEETPPWTSEEAERISPELIRQIGKQLLAQAEIGEDESENLE